LPDSGESTVTNSALSTQSKYVGLAGS
jgi:hypothetical protein